MNLCDFYTEAKGKTPEIAFNKALKAEKEHCQEDSHTGSIAEKKSFIEIEDSPDSINTAFRTKIKLLEQTNISKALIP